MEYYWHIEGAIIEDLLYINFYGTEVCKLVDKFSGE